jgi:hypothetical protein
MQLQLPSVSTLNRGGSMNDETISAGASQNQSPGIRPAPRPQPDRPLAYWVKQFLVCNPFYLASAALL